MSVGTGKRYDNDKLKIDLCPTSLIYAVSKVLEYGEKKYERNNWRGGMEWTKVWNCLQRHSLKWIDGEDIDDESKLSHLYHMAANIAMLIEYEETCPDLDNRWAGCKRDYRSFKTHDGLTDDDLNNMEKETVSKRSFEDRTNSFDTYEKVKVIETKFKKG